MSGTYSVQIAGVCHQQQAAIWRPPRCVSGTPWSPPPAAASPHPEGREWPRASVPPADFRLYIPCWLYPPRGWDRSGEDIFPSTHQVNAECNRHGSKLSLYTISVPTFVFGSADGSFEAPQSYAACFMIRRGIFYTRERRETGALCKQKDSRQKSIPMICSEILKPAILAIGEVHLTAV